MVVKKKQIISRFIAAITIINFLINICSINIVQASSYSYREAQVIARGFNQIKEDYNKNIRKNYVGNYDNEKTDILYYDGECKKNIENSKGELKEKTNTKVIVDNKQINNLQVHNSNVEKNDYKNKNHKKEQAIKSYKKFDIAIAGLLGNKDTELNQQNIEKYKNMIPKGNGIYILQKR